MLLSHAGNQDWLFAHGGFPILAAGDAVEQMGFQNPLSKSASPTRFCGCWIFNASVRVSTSLRKASISASFEVCGSSTTISTPSCICGSTSLTISLFFLFPRTGAMVLLDHW
jgi:hypothetical protein